MSLYNEMRPGKWADVKGQDKVVKVMKENLRSGHIPNAMLLVGTRGTGKTTVAKIFAKSVNCTNPTEDGGCCDCCESCRSIKNGTSLDVLELDAASNNSVDNVRDIIQQVQYKPTGAKKVVILDEVHMLSISAFNALLKVMEEPPKDVIFILCTTELHKIPATILSRSRKYTFETISVDVIVEKLRNINEKYGLTAEDGALYAVAKAAKGSMRDAESIYETFIDENGCITEALVRDTLGFSNEDIIFQILNSLIIGEPTGAFDALSSVIAKGGNLVYLLEECMKVLLDVVFIQSGGDLTGLTEDYLSKASELAFGGSMGKLLEICNAFNGAYEKKGNGNFELVFQGVIVSLLCEHSSINILEKKVAMLENELALLKTQPVQVPEMMPAMPMLEAMKMPSVDESSTEEAFESGDGVDFEAFDGEVRSDFEETVVKDTIPSTPVVEKPESTGGFVAISDEDVAELESLGFSFAETKELDVSKGEGEEEIKSSSNKDNESSGSNYFFDDFARQFGDFF